MYNTVLSFMQHPEDAEDVSQDVFMAVHQHIGSFRGDAKLSTWIYRIAVTKSLEALRKTRRRRSSTVPDGLQWLEEAEADRFHHPGVLVENRDRAAALFAALDRLPETQKTAFVLHKAEGLSHAEIGAIMALTQPAVESLIYRARRQLREWLTVFYAKDKNE